MKKWKKILFVAAGIFLVAIACFISWAYGFRQGIRAGGLTSSMAEFNLFHQHLKNNLENASCIGAKEALNDYLKHLEKYKGVKGSFISDTIYYGDMMLTHVRLARIEEYMGNHAEAQNQINIAKEACLQRKWEDCSYEKMVLMTKRLEERNPIGCLSSQK